MIDEFCGTIRAESRSIDGFVSRLRNGHQNWLADGDVVPIIHNYVLFCHLKAKKREPILALFLFSVETWTPSEPWQERVANRDRKA